MTRAGAVIVTGGGSRRMGRPKEWLELAGEPLLARVVRIVAGRCELVVVAAAADQVLPELAPEVRRVADPPEFQGQGPLVGLAQGLIALDEAGVVLAYLGSCDAARVTVDHVAYMLDRLHGGVADAVVAGAREGLRCHPLASAVRVAPARRAVEDLLAGGERRARRLFECLARVDFVAVTELADPRVLDSFNDPGEWEALLGE